MTNQRKRVLLCALLLIFLFVGNDLFSDSVQYKDGSVLQGKIVGQNMHSIFLEQENGNILRIGKEVVIRFTYFITPPKEEIKTESRHQRKAVIHLPTNTQPPAIPDIKPQKNDLSLGNNIYYLILKDEKSYLIRISGFNFNLIHKIYLENPQKEKEQEFYNLQSKSVEVVINSNDLDTGFYDLVIESKTGYRVRKEYFIEVKEP
jgi:hypothetical protein